MRNVKTLMVALVAVFAFSAVAASAAMATPPEFSKTGVKFTSSGGEAKLKSPAGTVKCTSISNSGKITGSKTGEVVVTFSGCKITIAGIESACENVSAGTIETKKLEMELGWVEKATLKVGVALKPKSGTELAKFKCKTSPEMELTIKGSVIGGITPTETETKKFTLAFAESVPAGKQAIQNLEGEAKDTLKVFVGNAESGEGIEVTTDELETAEAMKIIT
jgi:hypothetical protein